MAGKLQIRKVKYVDACTNIQQTPKCSTCEEPHPTYSYKCKQKPPAEETKPDLVVPIRTHDSINQPAPEITSAQPVTVDQLLNFITLTLQNIHPFIRPHILHQIQLVARTIFQLNFYATYNGPYVHFHSNPICTEV